MFSLEMSSEVTFDTRAVRTQGTLVRFLPRVNANMTGQLSSTRRPSAAEGTSYSGYAAPQGAVQRTRSHGQQLGERARLRRHQKFRLRWNVFE